MKDEDYNHNDKTTSSSPPDDLRGGGDKTDEKNGWVDEDQEYNNNTSDETQVYKVVKLKDIYIYIYMRRHLMLSTTTIIWLMDSTVMM